MVAVTGPVVAIGTSLGAIIVFQLPSIGTSAKDSAAPPMGAAASSASSAGGHTDAAVPLLLVGEARSEAEAVSSLGFSHVAVQGDPMWLMAGHASGTLVLWDLQKRPARHVSSIGARVHVPLPFAAE